ncbi:MAG: M20 family metallopeptidase [Chloroflexota bacterium]
MLSPLEQHALNQIDDDELILWVQELTRINSVWRPEQNLGEAEAAQWVAARCREIGLETHVEYPHPARPNVIALLDDRNGPTLMFEGHTDVVTEGNASQWRDPPFSAMIRDGRIIGRGANDMKAGLVCALIALKAIAQSGVPLRGNIMLGALCDEEGAMLGVKHFVARGWADRVTAAIICEPEENHLCICQKGAMWIRATIYGVMAHGAMPLTGANTAYPLARFLSLMHDLEAREIARYGSDPLLGEPSITPTVVLSPARGNGEPQHNVMPGASEVVLDFRLTPCQDADALARETEALLAATVTADARLRYAIDLLEARPPTQTNENEPIVAALASAYHDVTGCAPIFGGVPGSTDGTILHARKHIPVVTCGPGDIHIPHHVDEWVSIDEIKTAARMYVVAALRFLGTR